MRGRCALASILASSFLVGTQAWAQQQEGPIPHHQDRPPGPALSPEEAIRKMTVPPGFRVELVASEPDIVNPVAMTFDERGRVWITESLEYPRKSAGPGRDRIKVLEDSDGDGKADKFTTFADGLNIPSGIAVGAGGVWVANSPDILFLRDTDGDGKADTREVVVTGFGRHDTHELPNSLTWGPDGWLYGWNGVFNPARIEHRGQTFEFTCAIFRIHPKTRDFEVFCEGVSNPWGIAWNDDGEAFASACVIDHLWHLTETGYYHRQGGPYPPFTWKLESIVDHKHQKAAYCGIHYFDSDAYPAAYRDKLYMGNIHGNGVNADRLERRGATYRGRTEPDFLQANDAWFMPVVQKTGPDGCLYVLDWYDRYHCYQDANRDPLGIDRLKGRLYRVRYQDSPRAPRFDLAAESDDQLIGRLRSPNVYYREAAAQLLRERDSGPARPKLESLALDPTAPRKARMQALFALVGTGRLDPSFHARLLGHADPVVRAWGVRAAGNSRKVAPEVRSKVLAMAGDEAAEVGVQVAIASRKLEGVDPLPTLVAVVDRARTDPILAPIVWENLHPILDSRGADFVALVSKVDLARSAQLAAILPRAVDRLLGGTRPQPAPAVELVARMLSDPSRDGAEAQGRRTLEILADRLQPGALAEPRRAELRDLLKPVLAPILVGDPDRTWALDAAMVAVTWGDPAATGLAREVVESPGVDEPKRLRALNALVGTGDPTLVESLRPLLTDRQAGSTRFRGELLAALGRLDSPRVAPVVLAAYPRLEADLQPRAVELLTQRPAWSGPLLDAIGRNDVLASALNVNQVRKLAASRDRDIAARVKAIFGTVRESRNPDRERVIETMKAFLNDAQGDPAAGAVVFRNVCAQCHKLNGEGQEVGPDITLNGRGSYDQLLSNVFDPSLVIGPAFQATTVATSDGRVLTGLVVEDSPQRVILKLQGGKVETIPRAAIDESKLSPLSLMPEGIEAQLRPREVADLFAFITLENPPEARTVPGTPKGIRR